MTATARKPIFLSPDQKDYIDRLVEAGAYATTADVVDADLKALQAQDARLELWLREAIAPACDALLAEPSRNAISLDDAFADNCARHEKRRTTES